MVYCELKRREVNIHLTILVTSGALEHFIIDFSAILVTYYCHHLQHQHDYYHHYHYYYLYYFHHHHHHHHHIIIINAISVIVMMMMIVSILLPPDATPGTDGTDASSTAAVGTQRAHYPSV